MSTLNNILSKIDKADKIELSKQKVELGIAEDVKKAYNDAIAARKASFDTYMAIKAQVQKAIGDLNNAKSINEKALTVFAQYEKAAKDLGLALPADIVNNKQNIQDGLKGTLTAYPKTLASIKF